jgi:lipoprotein-releasing system ATP-binding protein
MSNLVVQHVAKSYPTATEPLVVLRDVSFELTGGESLAILGPSGCGKSTLLHILGALDKPTSGQVQLGDQNPFSLAEKELAHFRNREIGFVFQDHYLLPQLTVIENLLLPLLAFGVVTDASRERARMLLERVGLSERAGHLPSELSGGERGRAAIARALIAKPSLILADEPTGNLDRTTAKSVSMLMLEMQRDEGAMLIAVTHSLELAAMMQRRVELDAGALKSTS